MHETVIDELDRQVERSLGELGHLDDRIVGALVPARIGDKLVAWPWRTLGRIRIVRREHGVLFVTQGLAHPFDPSVHGPSHAPLGFELGIELSKAELPSTSSEDLAEAWVVPALLWLSACYVHDEFRLLDLIARFGMVTQALPPDPALDHLQLEDGSVGALAGMPLSPSSDFGLAAQRALAQVEGCDSRLVMLTVLTPDECGWVRGVNDGSRAMELAKALWAHGDGHITKLSRPSTLASLGEGR